MVTQLQICCVLMHVLLAEQKDPVLEQLDPPRRAAVIMALLALVLTGLFLVTCVMVGAHWVRRLARQRPATTSPEMADSQAQNRRLRHALRSVLPETKTEDTVDLRSSPSETRTD